MILFDVNVLIYSVNPQAVQHEQYRDWIAAATLGQSAFGVSELVLSAFVRITTHAKAVVVPSSIEEALNTVEQIRSRPNCVVIAPGPRHWEIFVDLCRRVGARGNIVPDAYLAALAIESGSEWITTDRDYSRFPGLRWRHPLDA
jgi:toxin-antitoxin system PIN domain toxin